MEQHKALIRSVFFGIGHGVNDFIGGYLLGSLLNCNLSTTTIGAGVFLYNTLAFGGQYFVAQAIEKGFSPVKMVYVSFLLNMIAAAAFFAAPQMAIVLAGIASALYHVAGGTLSATEKPQSSFMGLFAGPGVAGLIGGGYIAYKQLNVNVEIVGVILFLTVLFALFARKNHAAQKKKTEAAPIDTHDWLMIVLLTVISLRSVVWNVIELIQQNNYSWLFWIAISAMAGKIMGGFIADKIGWVRYTIISLLLSFPLLSFFKNQLVPLCIGIALLQSGIPATTCLIIHSVKNRISYGISLSLGAGVLISGVIFYLPLRAVFNTKPGIMISFLVMILLMYWFVINSNKREIGKQKI